MTPKFSIIPPSDVAIDISPFTLVQKRERWLTTQREVRQAFSEASSRLFVAFDSAELLRSLGNQPAMMHHRLLLLEKRDQRAEARTTMLAAFFRAMVVSDAGLSFLPIEELAEVLAAPNAADLAIATGYDEEAESIYVIRGNLDRLIIPTSSFVATPNGPEPVFEGVKVIDYGNALALGEYEASMDALLYEQDSNFRRELRKRQLENDDSFGASVRRLRIQRGLKRSDIPGISDKQVARIERGETENPQAETLNALAAALAVSVEELGDF